MNASAGPRGTGRRHYRSVFLSDTHLGTRGSQAAALAEFLAGFSCEQLYLVGDIIDGWRLRKSWYWDDAHDEVVRLLLAHARAGTEVIYIPGNHDEMLRRWLPHLALPGFDISGIRLRPEAIHTTADGRRLLVVHGDAFDSVVRYARFVALLGDSAYTLALVLNRWFNAGRRRLGLPYWSLSAFLKHQVKQAVKAIACFEDALAAEAHRRGFDGVVCGHIHQAEMRRIGDLLYCNTGDWVESCTALLEQPDGRLELYDWTEANALSLRASRTDRVLQAA